MIDVIILVMIKWFHCYLSEPMNMNQISTTKKIEIQDEEVEIKELTTKIMPTLTVQEPLLHQ